VWSLWHVAQDCPTSCTWAVAVRPHAAAGTAVVAGTGRGRLAAAPVGAEGVAGHNEQPFHSTPAGWDYWTQHRVTTARFGQPLQVCDAFQGQLGFTLTFKPRRSAGVERLSRGAPTPSTTKAGTVRYRALAMAASSGPRLARRWS